VDDKQANQMRAMLATRQLEIDTLKRRLRETEDKLAHEYNTRLRADKTRKKTVRVTESSDSDK
jgi:uncharacterized coiled-coil DUF342 family protein